MCKKRRRIIGTPKELLIGLGILTKRSILRKSGIRTLEIDEDFKILCLGGGGEGGFGNGKGKT